MSETHAICWNCQKAWDCPQAVAVGIDTCGAFDERTKPPRPARAPAKELSNKLWGNTPAHLHPKPWTSTDSKSQELADLRAKLAAANEELELHEALRRAGVYGTQSISAATMEVMATLRDLGIVGNGADLRAKLAAANEELSAIDAAMDKVDLPTRQDDWALTRVGRLLSLQDWWKDYAECTQKAVERAEAAERERDAAQAEAAALRKALEKMWLASRGHTPEIDNVNVTFECQACKEAHDEARAALRGEVKRE